MPRTRRATTWITLALAVLGTSAGCGGPETPAIAADSGVGGEDVVTVPVVLPERAELETTTTQPATVHPDHRAEIHAKIAGYLAELRADIGDEVEAGQVLGIVDVPEMDRARERQQAAIARLEADERRAAAEVDLSEADVEAARALLEQEKADIATARAGLDAERFEFDRVRGLVSEGAVTGQLLDEARERLESAEASLESANAASATAAANVDVARAKLAASRARLETSRADTEVACKELEELDARLSYKSLTSPFDGVITRRLVDPGDLVRDIQGASGVLPEPLFEVAKLDTVRVRVPIPEDDATRAGVGDPARVDFRSLPGEPIAGQVSRVARSLDPSTQTMLVEVDLPNPELRLMPGMYGEATIVLERAEGLVLPAGAVRHDEKGRSFVYVVDAGGTVRVVDVETGLDDGNRIQVASGLDGSERVVGPTIDRLQDGQRVRVAEE